MKYLGITNDMTGKEAKVYLDNQNIVVKYNEGTKNETVAQRNLNHILENEEKYLWTPYITFAYEAKEGI